MLNKIPNFISRIGKKSLNQFTQFRAFAVSPHMKDLADYDLKDISVDK